jgi:uncharacterized protein with PQ loop repeat
MLSNGFGLFDFLYDHLERFKDMLTRKQQRRVAHFLEKVVYIFCIAGPIMTAPQVARVYLSGQVAGLSIITWASYLFISSFWLIYAVFIKNKPLIVSNVFWILMHIMIVSGIIIYR